MKSEQIYKLLAKFFSNETTQDETKRVNDWLSESSENRIFYDEVKAVWENTQPESKIYNSDSAWENVKNKSFNIKDKSEKITYPQKKFSLNVHSYIKIAAGILIMLGFTYLYFNQNYKIDRAYDSVSVKQITSDKGEIRKIRLEDGTTVTLNSESVLEIPANFSNNIRMVSLTGEAYFEVARDSNRTFVVSTPTATVKVIGTKFNVTAWNKTSDVTVAVLEGKVLFSSKKTVNSVFINSGEMSTVNNGNSPKRPAKVDVEKYYSSWIHDELNFYNTSFKNIIHRLEIKYGINISVDDVSILSKHLTATFRDEPIDEILNTISIALDLKYTSDKDLIVFGYDN